MSRSSYIFTSESVSEGHPDKVADRISDTVVDAFLSADPEARVACETLVTTNRIVLAGEVRAGKPGGSKSENKAFTKDIVRSLEPKVRAAIKDIGYEQKGFHWNKAKYACHLHEQSAHIAQGVDSTDKKDEGAGDQGIMFGYACDETPALMPATLQYSHDILKKLADVRHSGECDVLEPDAKSQVTVRYEDGRPVEILQIVVSTQHKKRIGLHMSSPQKFWEGLAKAIERPDLLVRFPTREAKLHNYEAIGGELSRVFLTRTRDDWLPLLEANDVPFAPEHQLAELEDDPQVRHLGTFNEMQDPVHGKVRGINRAVRFDGDNDSAFLPPPQLDEHTDEILAELGLSASDIEGLRTRKIV